MVPRSCWRIGGYLLCRKENATLPRSHPPAFKRQKVELVRPGRTPRVVTFEPSARATAKDMQVLKGESMNPDLKQSLPREIFSRAHHATPELAGELPIEQPGGGLPCRPPGLLDHASVGIPPFAPLRATGARHPGRTRACPPLQAVRP